MQEPTPAQAEEIQSSAPQGEQNNTAAVLNGLDEKAYAEIVQQIKDETVSPAKAETPEAPKAPEVLPAPAKPDDEVDEVQATQPQAPEETPELELPERIRVGTWNETERKALQIRARNPDLSLAQALEMAGTKEPEAEVVDPSEVLDKIENSVKAKAEALKNLEFDKAAELELEVIKLQREMRKAEQLSEEARLVERETRVRKVEEAKSKAVRYYPDSADENSGLVKTMNEIYESLKSTQNPLIHDPEMPWKLTQMAANQLGIAPKVNGVKAVARAPSSIPVKQRNQAPIASGNARTTQPTPTTARDIANQIEDLDQLQLLVGRL